MQYDTCVKHPYLGCRHLQTKKVQSQSNRVKHKKLYMQYTIYSIKLNFSFNKFKKYRANQTGGKCTCSIYMIELNFSFSLLSIYYKNGLGIFTSSGGLFQTTHRIPHIVLKIFCLRLRWIKQPVEHNLRYLHCFVE